MDAHNFIYGQWVPAVDGQTAKSINPGNLNDTVGTYQDSTEADVEQAVQAAQEAVKPWRKLSGAERGAFLYKTADIMEERLDEIAKTAAREMGKTLAETKGETLRGIAILRYYAGEGLRKNGDVIPASDAKALMYTTRVPLGVVAVITPWNFPIAIPLWKTAPAIIYGNTVVLKPASETAVTCAKVVACFEAAGLPPGVLNFITGSGAKVGQSLVEHHRVNAITFTGSNTTGKKIGQTALARGAKYQLEMGGKNPVIVAADADIEQAVDATLSGAFKSTGQKCTATSRAFVDRAVYSTFKKLLLEKTKEIVVGDSLDAKTWMGPLASQNQLANCLAYIEKGLSEKATLLTGGHAIDQEKGSFIEPTIFECRDHHSSIAQEEIFGPVLALFEVDGIEEALRLANDVPYGLSASIFTKDIANMLAFIEDMDAGLIRVNAESAGVELQAPFGGMKQSSSHSREQGEAAKEFFTATKTIFVKA
ncbi:alpha-ketoglutaric semialdehyde dehydrogenase GucD [Shouchella clausii]|uniref:alpha-ketoglutaric semialdehyde dehydrogenase GucD n=1 Tax=Shouchella clausii TaxID=79880 RepID=UPI000BA62D06|nr:alpha-ketoglutaric semialdehyde dehydrogenase GucD [Shouchella clausii]PAD46583.1 aldehyde dehydrogenase family protein [Shouchella clausii]PAE91816.1 aldehyde dehydrogenase family protein [Shouchella clausii]